MSFAKNHKEKALKLFAIDDVDDEVDWRIESDEKIRHLCKGRDSHGHKLEEKMHKTLKKEPMFWGH